MGINKRFQVDRCPTNELSFTNCVIMSPEEQQKCYYIEITNTRSQKFHFTTFPSPEVKPGTLGFSKLQRKWAYLALNNDVSGRSLTKEEYSKLGEVLFTVQYFQPNTKDTTTFNTDDMAERFKKLLVATDETRRVNYPHVLSKDLQHLCNIQKQYLLFTVKTLKDQNDKETGMGMYSPSETKVIFERCPESSISLSGKSISRAGRSNIINPEFDFAKLGIGGLDDEFQEIFRRAFASRVVAPDLMQRMGGKHVKGILLFGPPGCGKTLMARQIGKLLSAREPQVVNGPEVLNKFVGESEAKIRKLFEPAEEEQKKLGMNSGLHIIIFDEIDAICKQRGSVGGASGVHDTIVNQLLSKIDGVEPLENILIIGMTNRPDLIDDALLRPGRLEVKKEISLPDEKGRLEILRIHCKKMIEGEFLSKDVDLEHLAKVTKNFSGAEIAGLVGAARSIAFVRHMKHGNKIEIDQNTIDDIEVHLSDFEAALANDIKPSFGSNEEEVQKYIPNGIIMWGSPVKQVMDKGALLIKQVQNNDKTRLVSVLLTGASGSGKTALAAEIASKSTFPFLKICSPSALIGYTESAKCQHLRKMFEDAYKSPISCIIIDDIEKLIEFNPIGLRFHNSVAQALMVLCKTLPPPNKRLLVIATSSNKEVMEQMEIDKSFDSHIHIPCLTSRDDISAVMQELQSFSPDERDSISRKMKSSAFIAIKQLIRMIGTAEEAEKDERVSTFLSLLEEEGGAKDI